MKQFLQMLILQLLVLGLVTEVSHAQKGNEVRIAVLELSNRVGLDAESVSYLTSILREQLSLSLSEQHILLDKENITTLLPPDKKIEDCVGECAVDTGRLF